MKCLPFGRGSLRLRGGFLLAALLSSALAGRAQQTASANSDSPDKLIEQINTKYPGLLSDLGHLAGRLQNDIHYPGPRKESRLLGVLPDTTEFYVAIPNYGDAAHQAAEILRSEVKDRAGLHDFVSKNKEWRELVPKIEDGLDRLSEAEQYLGDEIVLSGELTRHAPSLLLVAEVRKPGFKESVEKTLKEFSGAGKGGVRFVEPQDLPSTTFKKSKDELLMLLRRDYLAAGSDIETLRGFNERLERKEKRNGTASAFQERIGKEYADGASILVAADLRKVLTHLPPITQPAMGPLERNGFGDLQTLIWTRKSLEQETFSHGELRFASPRKGAAAWLGNSRRLTTLDFVSPKAAMAITLVLRNPAQIFDEIKALAGANQNGFVALAQFEKMLKVSLQDDVLANLSGEVTIEMDGLENRTPGWRVILGTKDSEHLKQTLDTLLAASPFRPRRFEQGGTSYTEVAIPQGGAPPGGEPVTMKIGYAFCDGRLIFGSGAEVVTEGVRLHRSGESLEKSPGLLAQLPVGRGLEASGLFFQDPAAMWSLQLRRMSPEMADAVTQLLGKQAPQLTAIYGDDTSIRMASHSSGTDVMTAMVVAAIAIPNLLRSRMAANEAGAVGSVRTINTAEITYQVAYPKRGFAPALSKLGPNHADAAKPTAEHADLLDDSLATENCTADGWCTKSGYRFNLAGICKANSCSDFVITATPVSSNTGSRSFCSTSNGIIRMRVAGAELALPLTASECQKWEPLQ